MDDNTTSKTAQFSTLSGHDGLALAAEQFGDAADTSILYAHGFGQNRLAWRSSAANLAAQGWPGLIFDGRGHGDSGWCADGAYQLDDFVADLMHLARGLAQPPVLVGASMGGLLALLSEAEAVGGLFRAIVLVDVTPRWETAGVERILSFMAAFPEGFASLEAASEAVSGYLPHREKRDPERLRGHMREGSDGRLRWHWDPRLLQHIPEAATRYIPRLQAAASQVRCPLLLLSGGKSDVVSGSTIAEFLKLVPHAEHREISDATHMVVGDRNDAFTAEIAAYLARLELVSPRPRN